MVKLVGNGFQLMAELESVPNPRPRVIIEWMSTDKMH